MGIRSAHNPYGSNTLLVDKMIGNAYKVVEFVARHMKLLHYISDNMEDIKDAAAGTNRNEVLVLATAGELGQTMLVPLPASVDVTKIVDYSVLVRGTNGALYSPDNLTFSSRIQDGALRLTLSPGGNSFMAGGQIRWLMNHRK